MTLEQTIYNLNGAWISNLVQEIRDAANIGCLTAAEKARELADLLDDATFGEECEDEANNLASSLQNFADHWDAAWDDLDEATEAVC